MLHNETNPDETIIDIPGSLEPEVTCCMRAKPFRPLLLAGPISVGLMDAADIAKSLSLHAPSPSIVFSGAFAAFLSAIGLTAETSKENFNETCEIIKKGFPNESSEWPTLPRTKEIIAVCLCIEPTLWGAFSEAAQGYYFFNGLPEEYKFAGDVSTFGWSLSSGGVGLGVGFTTILTESIEMYKILRKRLAGVSEPYSNKVSQFVSPLVGFPLGMFKAFQDSVESYIAISTILKISSVHGKVLVAIPSLINALPKFSFEGMFGINAMDEFFGYVEKRKFTTKKVLAFSFSAALAIYLSFLKRPLNELFYQEIIKDFQNYNFDTRGIPADFCDGLSWAMFVEESIRNTASLYLPMYHLIDKGAKKATSLANAIRDYCCPSFSPAKLADTAKKKASAFFSSAYDYFYPSSPPDNERTGLVVNDESGYSSDNNQIDDEVSSHSEKNVDKSLLFFYADQKKKNKWASQSDHEDKKPSKEKNKRHNKEEDPLKVSGHYSTLYGTYNTFNTLKNKYKKKKRFPHNKPKSRFNHGSL